MRPASFSCFYIKIPCCSLIYCYYSIVIIILLLHCCYYCPTCSFQLSDSDVQPAFHLQRDFETDLLSVVTEDAPGGAEEDETDPRPALENLLLQTCIISVSFCRRHISSTCQQATLL